jgi:CSLREA domain-containing protein
MNSQFACSDRKIHRFNIVLLAALILLLPISTASAAFGFLFIVTTTDDHNDGVCDDDCTLREAILAADNSVGTPDTIKFSVTGAINLGSPLPAITDDLTISGPGAEQLVVQRGSASGTPEFRIFNVTTTGKVSISGLTLNGGYATDSQGGGAICNFTTGVINLTNCILSNNLGMVGGAIANNSGRVFVTNCTLSNNTALSTNSDAYGGGIYNANGYVNVTGSTLSQNSASGNTSAGLDYGAGLGGGAYNTGTLIVTGCTFENNDANSWYGVTEGGGIYNDGALEVTNTTIYNNSCDAGGAGIYDIGTAIITNSTIAWNSSTANAGGIEHDRIAAHIQVKSCIIANNYGPNGDVEGAFTSGGFNLISRLDPDGSSGFPAPTDLTGTFAAPLDPKFGIFGYNGGPTKTLALLSTSPAIDKGTSNGLTGTLITDQRGVGYKRAINQSVPNAAGGDGTDIGAFEFGAHIKAVSRKAHGSVGNFDVSLLVFGPKIGVECRSGGSSQLFQIVVTFPRAVSVASISVVPDPNKAGATANVSSASVNAAQVTVNLSDVSNAQTISLSLHNVSDGVNTNDVIVPMGVLLGDVNSSRKVNSTDVSVTQSKVGEALSNANFREDVNLDGAIKSTDVSTVQSKVGTSLP